MLIEELEQLKEAMSILLAVYLSDRILLQVLKQYLLDVSKSFIVVTELYNKEKEFLSEETEDLIKQTKLLRMK